MEPALNSHQQFFDRVLGEFEAGHAGEAVLMLSGMLDASLDRGEGLAELRSAFTAHPLSTLCRHAAKSGNRLGDAVSRLGFARGLAARSELGGQAIERAWQAGKQILLLDCGERGELARLQALPLDNVALEHGDPAQFALLASRHAFAAPEPGHRFDLILATGWADRCRSADLSDRTSRIAGRLAHGGRLLLSAFVPGHLGCGWQSVCMGRDLHCHDEDGLAAAASAAGLSITQFRDSSSSLIWAELRRAGATSPARRQP